MYCILYSIYDVMSRTRVTELPKFKNLSSLLSNALKLLTFGADEGNDLSSLPEKPFFCMTANTGITGLPDGWPQARNGFIRFYNGNLAYTLDLIANYGNKRLAYRLATGDWAEIATATKPQEFDLPILDGWYTNDRAQYRKTQEGLVVVNAILELSEGYSASDNTQIAVLPEGFRPATSFMYPVSVQDGGTRSSAIVQIDASGTIIYYGASNTTAVFRIYLNAAFFATS